LLPEREAFRIDDSDIRNEAQLNSNAPSCFLQDEHNPIDVTISAIFVFVSVIESDIESGVLSRWTSAELHCE
jgi:hypothetical protein